MPKWSWRGWLGVVLVGWGTLAAAAPAFGPIRRLPRELEPPSPEPGEGRVSAVLPLRFAKVGVVATENGPAVRMPGLESYLVETLPEMPMWRTRVAVSPGSRARAFLNNLVLEESGGSLNLSAQPEAFFWHEESSFASPARGRYFPGTLIRAGEAEGALHIAVFPLQWDRQTGRALRIVSADLIVQTQDSTVFEIRDVGAAPSIILTARSLSAGARRLREFHQTAYGLTSAIVYVEDLAKSERPVDESELPEGYKDRAAADEQVKPYNPKTDEGYHYELARKIVSYLRARMEKGAGLQSVTLLGDSNLIPPSYYFSIRGAFRAKFTPTDQCYAALDRCSDPQLAVGRLPFERSDEVTTYLAKVARWMAFAPSAPSELSLFGGKPFPVEVYVGELGALLSLPENHATWRGVRKHFRTNRAYSKETLLSSVSGKDPSAFVYHFDHGLGNRWMVERDFVSSDEISALPPAESAAPMVVSISCLNAAFDEKLTKERLLPTSSGERSIGVSMLRSRAGAVAYLGSARPALGQPLYEFDAHGNLALKGSSYAMQILDTFFRRYHDARGGRLGESLLGAMKAFVHENGNDMKTDRNRWSYFNVALLGDPAMLLPDRSKREVVAHVARSLTDGMKDGWGRVFPSWPLATDQALTLAIEAAQDVVATLVGISKRGGSEKIVSRKALGSGKTQWELDRALGEGRFFARLENAKGVPVERQVWFRTLK